MPITLTRAPCGHTEPVVNDVYYPHLDALHDCEWVELRRRQIPAAEKVADAAAGDPPAPVDKDAPTAAKNAHDRALSRYNAAWNKAFHAEMERLVARARRRP